MLIRSTFWLAIAFVIVGPKVDIGGALADISGSAIEKTQQFSDQQTDVSTCRTIDCIGSKLVVSAGLNAVSDIAQSPIFSPVISSSEPGKANGSVAGQQISPQPRPRIFRAS